jgi:flagellar biosynthesis protein
MKKRKPPPPSRAVALRYDGRRAPTVLATGAGELARQILAVAQRHNIPLHEDPALLQALAHLELGEEIPAPLYRAVAQVLAFCYFLNGRMPPPRR